MSYLTVLSESYVELEIEGLMFNGCVIERDGIGFLRGKG